MTPAELRAARETLGLTQAEFADALGLGAQARISHMENGGTITRQTAAMVRALLEIQRLRGATAMSPNRKCPDCGQKVPTYRIAAWLDGAWHNGMGAAFFCGHECSGDHKPVAQVTD